jgi:hypothetical protein
MIPHPPYINQPVIAGTLHEPDVFHRNTWLSVTLKCGHEKEVEKRRDLPIRARCYACGREER